MLIGDEGAEFCSKEETKRKIVLKKNKHMGILGVFNNSTSEQIKKFDEVVKDKEYLCISCGINPYYGCPLKKCLDCLACSFCSLKDIDCKGVDCEDISGERNNELSDI